MMLSKTCSLIGMDSYNQYFTSTTGAILLYLSAKISDKYVEKYFQVTESNERDQIRLGLVHCFGLCKRPCRKRKRGTDGSSSSATNSAANSAANRSKDRLFFLIPEKVLEDVHAKFDFALDPKGLEFSSCIGWLISRTAWLKTIYKDLLKKYSPSNLPNPFDDYDTLLRETIIGNEARASVLSITQTSNPSIAMQQNNNNSNITNFNFL
jgi:hypothetical protein